MGKRVTVMLGGMWWTVMGKIHGRKGQRGLHFPVTLTCTGVCGHHPSVQGRTGLSRENDRGIEEGASSYLMLTSSVSVTGLHQSPSLPLHLDFSGLKKRQRQVECFLCHDRVQKKKKTNLSVEQGSCLGSVLSHF